MPAELDALLASHPDTIGSEFSAAYIEHQTQLPCSARGPRNHDLLLVGESGERHPLVVSVEAKADETFDERIGNKVATLKSPNSDFPDRVEWMTQYLFGESAFLDLPARSMKTLYSSMYYQLFSAVTGVCIEAHNRSIDRAVLIVHEFRTHLTEDRLLAENDRALALFFEHLWRRNSNITPVPKRQPLAGPVTLRTGEFKGIAFPDSIQLYIGKLRTDLG